MLLMALGTAVLLPGMAVLQYRWIGQLSESEIERMRANLHTSAEYFHDAFDRELAPFRWLFRVSLAGSPEEIGNQLAQNFRQWERMTEHPGLIDGVYWIDYAGPHTIRLHVLDAEAGAIHEIPWTEELIGWRAYIAQRNDLQREALTSAPARTHTERDDALAALRAQGAALLLDSPALPIPVSIDPEINRDDLLANLDATIQGRAGYTLLVLNRSYLVDTLLTSLATRFAGSSDGAGYHVMIVGQDDEEQVYFRTASHLAPDDFESPDAVHVMGSAFFWQREPLTPGAMVVRGYAALANRDEAMARLLVSRAEEDRLPTIPDRLPYESVAHEPPFPLQAVLRMAREDEVEGRLTTEYLLSALSRLQDEAAFPRPPAPSDNVALVADDGRHAWKLMFKHRAGSLEASVRANRTRNLFLSFGILLLLTAAVGLLYNSLRRARRLAEQQMEFVAGVSHELRTPLAVIHSAAENLADGVVQNAEQSKRYGDLIRKEGRRLTEMVEQVLELAGVQSGRRRYTFRPASVASTIERALSSCDGALREAGFAVSKSIAPNLPETAIDDRAIQTALRNLITNAIKYSDGQTWLGIEARVEQNGKGPAIAITVRDKGRGIPAYELPFIFDRFYRGHAVREAQIHGNGLGLSLVKSTVEAHGGQVTVESEPGKGSAFTLHLPVRPVEAAEAAPAD
jgi:signal transduction histidine kinase